MIRLFFSDGWLRSMVAAANSGLIRFHSGGSSRTSEIGSRGAHQHQPQPQPPPEAQPSDHQPMIDHRGGQQIRQDPDGQRDQTAGDVDPFDVPPSFFDPPLDDDFALGRRRDRGFWRRR